jgi:hypothetical protein
VYWVGALGAAVVGGGVFTICRFAMVGAEVGVHVLGGCVGSMLSDVTTGAFVGGEVCAWAMSVEGLGVEGMLVSVKSLS